MFDCLTERVKKTFKKRFGMFFNWRKDAKIIAGNDQHFFWRKLERQLCKGTVPRKSV
jgi:hypothetical protein